MTSAPLFKTPTCTPPKNPSTPLSMITSVTPEEEANCASTPTNQICRCNDNSIINDKNPERCSLCGHQIRFAVLNAVSTPEMPAALNELSMANLMTDSAGPSLSK